MKPRIHEPRQLDIAAFAKAQGVLDGEIALRDLPRLAASAWQGGDAPAVRAARWSAEGAVRAVVGGEPEIWLHLQAEGEIALQCQRCLHAVVEPLRVDRRFRFARDDDEAARLDEELDDDVLTLERRFDLLELLEDELLLALPLVPRHETCPQPLPLVAEEPEPARQERPNPFAVLETLRKAKPGS
jgi:uncharacterized protein